MNPPPCTHSTTGLGAPPAPSRLIDVQVRHRRSQRRTATRRSVTVAATGPKPDGGVTSWFLLNTEATSAAPGCTEVSYSATAPATRGAPPGDARSDAGPIRHEEAIHPGTGGAWNPALRVLECAPWPESGYRISWASGMCCCKMNELTVAITMSYCRLPPGWAE